MQSTLPQTSCGVLISGSTPAIKGVLKILHLTLLLLRVRVTDFRALARRVPPDHTALLARLLLKVAQRHFIGATVAVGAVASEEHGGRCRNAAQLSRIPPLW